MTYFGVRDGLTNQWGGILANTFIHTCMYYYFFIASFGYNPWWKKHLTTMQMIQFVCISTTLISWLWIHYFTNWSCEGTVRACVLNLWGNVTVLLLFMQFYYHTYVQPKKGGTKKQDNGHVD